MHGSLLQELIDLQRRHGRHSDETPRKLADETGTPLYQVQAVTTFHPHYRRSPPPRATVAVCRDCACHPNGGRKFMADVKAGFAAATDVEVHEVDLRTRAGRADPATSVLKLFLEEARR